MPVAPHLAYPDATAAVTAAIRPLLAAALGRTIRVASRIPNPRPAELVTVTRTGGPAVMPMVDGAQLTIDCWAATNETVWDLAATVRRLVHNLSGTGDVHRVVEIGGPQDLPDPVSNTPRVTFTVQVQIRGHAA